jgi:hypothetical protein
MSNKEFEFKELSIDSIIYPDGEEGVIQHANISDKPRYRFIYLDYVEV